MVVILIVEVAVGSVAFAMKDRAKSETKNFLVETIADHYATPEKADAVTLVWNNIMKQVRVAGSEIIIGPLTN